MALTELRFFSRTLNLQTTVSVILPEGTQGIGVDGAREETEEFPVLYLLHGKTDDHSIWQRRTSVERYASDKNLAIVMPETHLGAYTDQKYGYRYMTYVSEEVPAVCHRMFRISAAREKSFVAGLSMGGYGALKIGLLCGDRFSKVAAYSSGCDRYLSLPAWTREVSSITALRGMEGSVPQREYDDAMHFFLTFGSPEEYLQDETNNLFLLCDRVMREKRPLPEIYMSCGMEDAAFEKNLRLHRRMEEAGIPHTFVQDHGGHAWSYWDRHIQDTLQWVCGGKG